MRAILICSSLSLTQDRQTQQTSSEQSRDKRNYFVSHENENLRFGGKELIALIHFLHLWSRDTNEGVPGGAQLQMSGLIPHNGHQSGGNSVFDVGSTPAKTIHIISGNRRFCRSQTPNTRDSASGTRPADGLQPASGTGKRRHIVCCRMPELIQSRWRGWCDGVACGKGVNG